MNKTKINVCMVESDNPNPLGCVQNRIQIGGFGTVRVNRVGLQLVNASSL